MNADLLAVAERIEAAFAPGHFFAANPWRWRLAQAETLPWEVFRGHLLQPGECRSQTSFLTWDLAEPASEQAVLSIKLDPARACVHVTRSILCDVQEGYDSGGGVMRTREVRRWERELVGTALLADFASLEEFEDELRCVLTQAVVGLGKLPLTSLEAPLPDFILGQLGYVALTQVLRPQTLHSIDELLDRGLQPELRWRDKVKLVELALRALPAGEVPGFARRLARRWQDCGERAGDLARLLRSLYHEVSLSPYTQLVDHSLDLLQCLAQNGVLGAAEEVDFHSWLLRLVCRHLTAYDLVTFHYRGANYPDALLLDAVLQRFLHRAGAYPDLFRADDALAQRRRRALRQACLLRLAYQGHAVPDVPTSPGENARVMPAGFPRVPEAQLLQVLKRRRVLFDDAPLRDLLDPAARLLLAQSLGDLAQPRERRELGLGLFVDRPLGYAKLAGEVDLTPMLAHEAYSPSLAQRRWGLLGQLAEAADCACPGAPASPQNLPGVPHHVLASPVRPTVCLADVRRVADDFVIQRTLPLGLAQLWGSLRIPQPPARVVCVLAAPTAEQVILTAFDGDYLRAAEISVDLRPGFRRRAGVESPRAQTEVRDRKQLD